MCFDEDLFSSLFETSSSENGSPTSEDTEFINDCDNNDILVSPKNNDNIVFASTAVADNTSETEEVSVLFHFLFFFLNFMNIVVDGENRNTVCFIRQ